MGNGFSLKPVGAFGYMGALSSAWIAPIMGPGVPRLFRLLAVLVSLLVALPPAAAWAHGAPAPEVTAVRIAAHDDMTRFVLELSAHPRFTLETAPDGVVVRFPALDWSFARRDGHRAVGVLGGWSYQGQGPGGALTLRGKGPVTVRKDFIMPPSGTRGYRLVLDVAAAGPSAAAAAPPPPPPPGRTGGRPLMVITSGNPLLTPRADAPRIPVPTAAEDRAAAAAATRGDVAAPVTPALASAPRPARAGHERHARSERQDKSGQKPLVVVDPGHGGVDPGATSLSGVYEKNIVLALAHDVKADLLRDGKVRCILTRDGDTFIPLRGRVAFSRSHHADLFMSLHADTVDDPGIHGLSVYTLSQTASDTEAQALADKENKSDIVAGLDLSNEPAEVTNILIDLAQRESMNKSAVFAARIIRAVQQGTHDVLQGSTHRFAGFAVLKAPDVPSVLVETGYLSNAHDERMLRSPQYRAKLAHALAKAIESYFAKAGQ
ncbi:N-acetylmuramoyl-L-alanine amidase AmiA precursor [mine drainage metagenome]|uniref:N-acetylmuramoyl-L-alanine amidase AmiA n=1 Tax=mine drainage metagenome TaxID=410659 RepID=A0A1J5RIG0_9ZZZZ